MPPTHTAIVHMFNWTTVLCPPSHVFRVGHHWLYHSYMGGIPGTVGDIYIPGGRTRMHEPLHSSIQLVMTTSGGGYYTAGKME